MKNILHDKSDTVQYTCTIVNGRYFNCVTVHVTCTIVHIVKMQPYTVYLANKKIVQKHMVQFPQDRNLGLILSLFHR